MGRAMFLMYPWLIFFNRAAMGRARFMLYPWFIFLLIFLTARPWAERGSCSTLGVFFVYFFNLAAMGRERFLIYLFIFFCFVGEQT